MMFKPFNLVRAKCFISTGIFQHFAFYSLAWWLYSNSDTRSGISSKLRSRWCSNHSIWWEPNFSKAPDFSAFCLLQPSLIRYSNSDTRSGICSKLRSRWYTNHPIWWGPNFSKGWDFSAFCLLQPSLIRYSNSDTRSGISSKLRSW